MQKLTDFNLIGIPRPGSTQIPSQALPPQIAAKVAQIPTGDPSGCTLSLSQALAAKTSPALLGTTSGTASANPSGFATGTRGGPNSAPPLVPRPRSSARPGGAANRDSDGAVFITERQAEGFLPPGRYKVRDANGTIQSTLEIGAGACSMGRALVLDRRRVQGAAKRLVKERAIQDDLFGRVR